MPKVIYLKQLTQSGLFLKVLFRYICRGNLRKMACARQAKVSAINTCSLCRGFLEVLTQAIVYVVVI